MKKHVVEKFSSFCANLHAIIIMKLYKMIITRIIRNFDFYPNFAIHFVRY